MRTMGAKPTCALASASSALPSSPGETVSPGLSIATTHTQARYVLPSILCRFRELHPHLPIHLRQGDSGQIPDLIARCEAHMAIASGSDPAFASMLRVPCFRWRRVIVTPEDHPLAYVNQPTLAQLAAYPLITYTPSTRRVSSLMAAFHREGLQPELAVTASDTGVLKAYIRKGMGVGILADLAIDGEEDADLRVRNATHLFEPLTTWAGLSRGLHPDSTFDLVAMLAPHLGPQGAAQLRQCASQADIDRLVLPHRLPFRR